MKNLASKSLFELLLALLRPAAAFCLRRGLSIQDFQEAAKRVFLEQAAADLKSRKLEPNISRLGAATGIHRRDVMRIVRDKLPPPESKSLISRVIGQWQYDRRFSEAKGKPRLLSFEGSESEFFSLIESITNDLHPTTILGEMERAGLVERRKGGLKLVRQSFSGAGNLKEASRMLGRDLHYLTAAVEENIVDRSAVPHLHATTDFDNIRVDMIPNIRQWLLTEGSRFQAQVRSYLAQYDLDICPASDAPGGARVVVSTFGYTEEAKEL